MPYYNTVISKMRCDMWSHSSFSDTQQSQMMEKHSWHTNEAIISLYNITKNDCSHSFILLSFSHCTLMQLLYKKSSFFFFAVLCDFSFERMTKAPSTENNLPSVCLPEPPQDTSLLLYHSAFHSRPLHLATRINQQHKNTGRTSPRAPLLSGTH